MHLYRPKYLFSNHERPVSEFNEFEPRLKSANNRFQLNTGSIIETMNTIVRCLVNSKAMNSTLNLYLLAWIFKELLYFQLLNFVCEIQSILTWIQIKKFLS